MLYRGREQQTRYVLNLRVRTRVTERSPSEVTVYYSSVRVLKGEEGAWWNQLRSPPPASNHRKADVGAGDRHARAQSFVV